MIAWKRVMEYLFIAALQVSIIGSTRQARDPDPSEFPPGRPEILKHDNLSHTHTL